MLASTKGRRCNPGLPKPSEAGRRHRQAPQAKSWPPSVATPQLPGRSLRWRLPRRSAARCSPLPHCAKRLQAHTAARWGGARTLPSAAPLLLLALGTNSPACGRRREAGSGTPAEDATVLIAAQECTEPGWSVHSAPELWSRLPSRENQSRLKPQPQCTRRGGGNRLLAPDWR